MVKIKKNLRKLWEMRQWTLLIMGIVLLISLSIRFLTLNNAELVWDEVAWVMVGERFYSFIQSKLPFPFYIFSLFFLLGIILLIEMIGPLFLRIKNTDRPNTYLITLILVFLIFAVIWTPLSFLINFKDTQFYHNPTHPSLYPILISVIRLMTPITSPELAGKVLSILALSLLSFTGFFYSCNYLG